MRAVDIVHDQQDEEFWDSREKRKLQDLRAAKLQAKAGVLTTDDNHLWQGTGSFFIRSPQFS
jgi:hypothetical protein